MDLALWRVIRLSLIHIFKCKFQGFQDAVEREILKKMPGANVIAAEYEPVIGAVLLGLKRMNRVLAGGIYRNIEERCV